MADILLPNDKFKDYTVVASVYYGEGFDEALYLVLDETWPYFGVTHSVWNGENWVPVGTFGWFENIVPAVRHYEDNGGDY